MARSSKLLLLFGILLTATFFRFHHLTSTPPGLYMDEAMDGNNAVEVAETGQFKSFYPEDNGREGLYINVLALMFKAHPCSEAWCVRLPSAVAGVLTVAGTYFLLTELLDETSALFAAFFMAAGFWPVILSRLGFRANFAVLLFVWTVYFFWHFLHLEGRRAWLCGVIAGVLYGLSFYTYIPIRITPVLFLLLIVLHRRTKSILAKSLVFTSVAVAVAAPLGIHFVRHRGDFSERTSQISVMNSPAPLRNFLSGLVHEVAMVNFHGDRNWRHNIFKAPELFLPVSLLFWFGFLYGAWRLVKRWRSPSLGPAQQELWPVHSILILLVWYVIAIIPASAALTVPSALRSILMIPPIFAFAGLAGSELLRRARSTGRGLLAQVAIGLLVCASLTHTYVRYFITYAPDPNTAEFFDEEDAVKARAINALPSSTTKYIVVQSTPEDIYERGFPLVAQTTMFLTHSFTQQDRDAANIHYVLDSKVDAIPAGTPAANVFRVGRIRN